MGWNDSRISLIAPGWKMASEEDSFGVRTAIGRPLRILYPERVEGSNSQYIGPESLQSWLEERGFEVRQRSEYGNRLQWEDVEAILGVEDGALAEVALTFTLTRDSPSRLEIWKSLVQHLCESWGLGMYASSLGLTVEADQFLRLLADTTAWKDFEMNFKWSPI